MKHITEIKEDTFDIVFAELVPKMVDTKPRLFLNDTRYWNYATNEACHFFARLPEAYAGTVSEERFERKYALFCQGEAPYCVCLVVKFNYLLLVGDTHIDCPSFVLQFRDVTQEATRAVLAAALEQFYLRAKGINPGTFSVGKERGSDLISRDLEFLADYFPIGTKIHARVNFGGANGIQEYVL